MQFSLEKIHFSGYSPCWRTKIGHHFRSDGGMSYNFTVKPRQNFKTYFNRGLHETSLGLPLRRRFGVKLTVDIVLTVARSVSHYP